MPDKHAALGPSKAAQWIHCPPSVKLEEGFPDTGSEEANEGTFAHKLAEEVLRYNNGEYTKAVFNRKIAKMKEDPRYSDGMMEYVEEYAAFVWEQVNEIRNTCKDPLILFEQELHFEQYVPGGFGTGDVVIIADDTAHVIDFKYGKGVAVSADGNPQLRLYAIGVLLEYSDLYDIQKVKMTIVQPRLNSVTSDMMSAADLYTWADEVVKPAAELAENGNGHQEVGEHCRWCKAKAACKAQKEYQLALAKYEFADAGLLDEDEIADVLSRVDGLIKWASQVKEYALKQALEDHVKYPGYKLVEGRSNRRYADPAAIADTLMKADYAKERIYKPMELIGITDMEKLLGKKKFGELIGQYVEKPEGKPALVPESDKRPELNTVAKAAADFTQTEKEETE